MLREITAYEREKWFDGTYFMIEEGETDVFLSYGDELGEAFDATVSCANKGDYGLSGWFVNAAQVQVLDLYYDQILLYTGEYGGADEPEDLGLPPREVFLAKAKEMNVEELSYFGEPERKDDERRLWDWAMKWREDHMEEFTEKKRIERLEYELKLAKLRSEQNV